MADTKLLGNDFAGGGLSFRDKLIVLPCVALASGVINYIQINLYSAMNVFKAPIYNDNGSNYPGALAASTSEQVLASGYQQVPIGPVNIIKNNKYYLAVAGGGYPGWTGIYYTSAPPSYIVEITYAGFTFPNPFYGSEYPTSTIVSLSGWGEATPTGCPRQAMFLKMMG